MLHFGNGAANLDVLAPGLQMSQWQMFVNGTGRIVSGSKTKPIRTFKKHTDQLAPKHGSWTGICATCTSLRDVTHQINGNFGLS